MKLSDIKYTLINICAGSDSVDVKFEMGEDQPTTVVINWWAEHHYLESMYLTLKEFKDLISGAQAYGS